MKHMCELSDAETVLRSRECIGTSNEAKQRHARADCQTSADRKSVRGPWMTSGRDYGGAVVLHVEAHIWKTSRLS